MDRSKASNFVLKLFAMVDTGDDKIISWQSDGKGFIIPSIAKLEKNLLPIFFRHGKFSSLVRQLNFYNFRKMNRRSNVCCVYAHPQFTRGGEKELVNLRRKTCLGADGRSSEAVLARKKGGAGEEEGEEKEASYETPRTPFSSSLIDAHSDDELANSQDNDNNYKKKPSTPTTTTINKRSAFSSYSTSNMNIDANIDEGQRAIDSDGVLVVSKLKKFKRLRTSSSTREDVSFRLIEESDDDEGGKEEGGEEEEDLAVQEDFIQATPLKISAIITPPSSYLKETNMSFTQCALSEQIKYKIKKHSPKNYSETLGGMLAEHCLLLDPQTLELVDLFEEHEVIRGEFVAYKNALMPGSQPSAEGCKRIFMAFCYNYLQDLFAVGGELRKSLEKEEEKIVGGCLRKWIAHLCQSVLTS